MDYNNNSNLISTSSNVVQIATENNRATNAMIISFDVSLNSIGDAKIYNNLSAVAKDFAQTTNTYKQAKILFGLQSPSGTQLNLRSENSLGKLIILNALDAIEQTFATFTTPILTETQINAVKALAKASLRLKFTTTKPTTEHPEGEVVVENKDYLIDFKSDEPKTLQDIVNVLIDFIPDALISASSDGKIIFTSTEGGEGEIEMIANAVVGYSDLFGSLYFDGANGVKVAGITDSISLEDIQTKLTQFYTRLGKYIAPMFITSIQLDDVMAIELAKWVYTNNASLQRVLYLHGINQGNPNTSVFTAELAENQLFHVSAVKITTEDIAQALISAHINTELSKSVAVAMATLLSVNPVPAIGDPIPTRALPPFIGVANGIQNFCAIDTDWDNVNSEANVIVLNTLSDAGFICYEYTTADSVQLVSKIRLVNNTTQGVSDLKCDIKSELLVSQIQQACGFALKDYTSANGLGQKSNTTITSIIAYLQGQILFPASQRGVFNDKDRRQSVLQNQPIPTQFETKQNIIKQNLIDFGFALNGTINENIGEFELLIFNGIDIQKIELTQTALRD